MTHDLPAHLRPLDRAVAAAAAAVAGRDAAAFDDAVAALAAADPTHVRRLLEAVLRPALEARHPDGVDGDDLASLLDELVASSGWAAAAGAAGVDPLAVAIVLTGAFGIEVATPDELPHPVPPAQLVRHALLVTGHVLPSHRDLRRALDAAWLELARADAQD